MIAYKNGGVNENTAPLNCAPSLRGATATWQSRKAQWNRLIYTNRELAGLLRSTRNDNGKGVNENIAPPLFIAFYLTVK